MRKSYQETEAYDEGHLAWTIVAVDLCRKNESMKKSVTELSRKWLDAQTWERLLSGYEQSALSVKEYWARHGVSAASYYRWQKRLSGEKGGELFIRVVAMGYCLRDSTKFHFILRYPEYSGHRIAPIATTLYYMAAIISPRSI